MAASQALAEEFEQKGWSCTVLDPYTLRSRRTAKLVGEGYVSLVQHSAKLFGDVYQIGALYDELERRWNLPDPVMDMQRHMADLLYAWLKKNPQDVIICTHPYPAFMLSLLKLQKKPLPPTFMVATDYTCIPLENDTLCDWMVIPAKSLMNEFMNAGFRQGRLLPFGIPTSPELSHLPKRSEACCRLGLDPYFRYILMAGGSMGSATLESSIPDVLELAGGMPDVKVILICGHNDQLYQQYKALKDPRLITVGFTDQMSLYYAVSSLYVSKPGGLSTTEACMCNLPLILCDPIPGCETRNAGFFSNWGMAAYARNSEQLLALIRQYLDPLAVSHMQLMQRIHLPHEAAASLEQFAWVAMHIKEKEQQKQNQRSALPEGAKTIHFPLKLHHK